MADNTNKKLFLLDAYALIFRAYYALIKMPRITRDGFNTSAIFGFVNTLEEILRKEQPTHIAVCFDPPGPTFRHEASKEYKAERSETPEDIKLSVPIIKEIIRAYHIPIVEVAGFEADDVIGTLARMAEKEGFTTYMMTPDKDFGQLVTPSIIQYKPSYRGQDFEMRGPKEVCERYGLQNTLQVIDLLALMGDKIDNIPGCPGVGEKTAVKLINDFGSVEHLLSNTNQLKGALKKKIEENAEQIRFSKFMATIRTDVPVETTPDRLQRMPEDRSKLLAIFKELEFKALADRVLRRIDGMIPTSSSRTESSDKPKASFTPGGFPTSLFDLDDTDPQQIHSTAAPQPPAEIDYKTVDTPAALAEFNRSLEGVARIGLFLDTEGENDVSAQWKGTAISAIPGKAVYIPSTFAEGKAFVQDLMSLPSVEKVTLTAKRDMVIAGNLANFYDLTLAHYVLQPEMRHTVESLATTYLEIDTVDSEPTYIADMSLRIYHPLSEEVKRLGMESLLRDLEFPLVPVLAEMETAGVRIDIEALNNAADEMTLRIESVEQEVYELAGIEFNIGSPAKVGEVLFDILHLDDKAKKTKTGQYSTSEDILEKLTPKHPIVRKILEYRQLKKLLSTYLLALPQAINPATGKVHTNYNQSITATGRLSSTSPNLQNIPVRDNEGREIRRAFIADPGCLFLSADYSQIELRLMADFSGDPIMVEAFKKGEDIHAITAAKIYHKDISEVSEQERRAAKTANFGILYGISAFGLSQRLGMPRKEAQDLINNYFKTFPTIKKYQSDAVEHARETGYVETKMGRRRILPDINSKNPTVRGYAERNAMNAPLQGTAADIIKRAMINIRKEMLEKGLKSKMIMQIHDELNFNVVEGELSTLQEIVTRNMESAYSGLVPLTASCGVATNWLDAH